MQVSHTLDRLHVTFDDQRLVAEAGLLLPATLAQHLGVRDLIDASAFCSQPGRRFSAFALITFVHALMHEYGIAKTEAAFASAKVAVTQQLPAWVHTTDRVPS